MDGDYSNRAALEDFIGYKLRQRGLAQRLALPPSPPLPLNPLHLAMREAGDEFEARFTSTFSRLSSQLHVTPTLVHQRLAQVSAELFTGDTNWGRLVAFFAFGAALCEECVDKEMPTLVSQVIAWMANYLDHNLQDWIQRNGGWGKFVLLYGNGAAAESRKMREGYWSSMKTVVTGAMAVGAFLTLGAFFASK